MVHGPGAGAGERGTPACDLFSLGCVLYELCTDELPFPGTSVLAVLTSLANDTPPAPAIGIRPSRRRWMG